jgi:hypothetical protein
MSNTTTTPTQRATSDGMAIAGFVCGCVGILMFWMYAILPILAITFSGISIGKSKRNGFQPSGLAIAGLILGLIEMAVIVAIVIAVIAAA